MPRCYRVNKLTIPTTLINLLVLPLSIIFLFMTFYFPSLNEVFPSKFSC